MGCWFEKYGSVRFEIEQKDEVNLDVTSLYRTTLIPTKKVGTKAGQSCDSNSNCNVGLFVVATKLDQHYGWCWRCQWTTILAGDIL